MIPKAVERGAGRIAKTGSRPTWSQGILAGSLQVVHTKCGERRPRCCHIDARPPRHIWRSGTNWCAWPFWIEQRKGSGSR